MREQPPGGVAAVAARVAPRVIWACTAILLALGMLVITSARADAADYPGYAQVQAAKAAVRKANATVAQLDAAVAQLNDAVHEADVAVRAADDAYAEAQQKNEESQLALFMANARADEATRALEKARADLASLARAEYRSGGEFGAIEAVASSSGFEDVIIRSEALDRANQTAQIAIDNVRAAELVEKTLRDFADDAAANAVEAENAANDALAHAVEVSAQADQALAEAEVARDQAIIRLAELKRSSASLEWQRQVGLAAARQAAAERAAHSRSSSSKPPVGGYSKGTQDKGERAVNYALAQVGDMYLYGATGPNRWDCSGLTMVAWKKQGVYLPRSSKAQYAYVKKIPYSELRAGDLIFWGSGGRASRVYHVSMYVRNHIIVEATKTGYPVKTRDYRNWAAGDRMPYAGRP
jgi:cell wall-associated NlpC family hydrolase